MKKGFTLVELLAVIVIIGIVSVIVFPNVTSIIVSSKKALYNDQVKDIEKAAQKWIADEPDNLDKYNLNNVYVSLKILQKKQFLEKGSIKSPLTGEEMNGCVQIKYSIEDNKYDYIYVEKSCDEAVKDMDDSLGYVVHSYDNTGAENTYSNQVRSAGEFIYEKYKDNIHIDGETVSGLYEVADEYVFRGSDVNNYVDVMGKDENGNSTKSRFRILSINKKDFSLRLMSLANTSSWDDNNNKEYSQSSINISLNSDDKYNIVKIVNDDFKTGIIKEAESYSLDALNSILAKTSSMKYGILSIVDYVNASATLECSSNHLSSNCKTNNYIADMIGSSNTMWTLNTSDDKIWYVDENGNLTLSSSGDTVRKYFTVVRLAPCAYIEKESIAVGSESSPYIIK